MPDHATAVTEPDCAVCRKHRGEGPLVGPIVFEDGLVVVSHRPTGPLGYVFIETRRHAPALDDLTREEAVAVGRVRGEVARGLRTLLDVERVHSLVAGLSVPHFHEHVFVRHAGTPAGHAWNEPWAGAPRGDIRLLAERLRPHPGG